MRVSATTDLAVDTTADTVVVGLVDGEGIAHDAGGAMQALVDAGEARSRFRHLAVTHAAGKRWIVVGLGRRTELDAERARVAAAVAVGRARELGARHLCWELPHHTGDDVAGALVEGTVLAGYRFERFKKPVGDRGPELEALEMAAHHDVAAAVEAAATRAGAVVRTRDLQNTPANELTPTQLGQVAQTLAADLDHVTCEVHGRAGLEELDMGCFLAVARGSEEEPALLVLRYEPPEAAGPLLGLVGKAVTFDSGGISLKNANGMWEMKYDMSGGAAVLGAVEAIARLGLPVRVLALVGATENLPSGRALKPGDVVRARNGTTVEVINTDAEGRLVLADCLAYAVDLGAERLVDVATLTGAIVTALGGTFAGLFAGHDAWAAEIEAAGTRTGELVWRLPLHREYDELLESRTADVANVNERRRAGSAVAAGFLRRFTGDVPWAHLDIAGTAQDLARPYAPKGGSGWGVRLLVDLAAAVAAGAAGAGGAAGSAPGA